MEAEEAAYQSGAGGASIYPRLDAGGKFSLLNHPCDEDGKTFVIRRVRCTRRPDSRLPGHTPAHRHDTANTFEAIPHEVPFRPLRVTGKPFAHGPAKTAIVVGPAGEKIFTDKVRPGAGTVFTGDRSPGKYQRDDKSSCWIRVSQLWVHGRGWGGVNLPHVGHDEGWYPSWKAIPDRPLDNRASMQWREPHGDGDAGQQDAERDP